VPPALRVAAFVPDRAARELIAPLLHGVDIHWLPESFASPREAVNQIADAQTVLLLVATDGRVEWLGLVRSDPATRRLPTVALVATTEGERQAALYKATVIVNLNELTAPLSELLRNHARVVADPAVLADQCAAPLPPLVLKGLHEFNTGEYFECHETLETAWMQETGPVRDVYRAILQIAVAYLQITRGNYRGAHKMFMRAVQWIMPLPDRCHGIDIRQLKIDAAAARTHLEAVGESGMAAFDRTQLKPIRYKHTTHEG
jgi:hypothetical protein